MKLFIISSRFPYPLEKGDKLRLYYQIQQLATRFEITLACISDQEVSEASMDQLRPYCQEIHIFRIKWPGIILNLLSGFLKGLPLQIAYFFNSNILRKVDTLIEVTHPDRIYCQLIRVAEYVKSQPGHKTLDYMDCFSHGAAKRSQYCSLWTRWFWNLEAKRLSNYESSIYPRFDAHTVISQQDATNFSLKSTQILTPVSNGLAPQFFKLTVTGTRDIDLLFLGNLQYYSNIQAVKYLIKEVIPQIAQSDRKLKIVIAGADPDQALAKWIANSEYPIDLIANPESSAAVYLRAKVFAAPITLGTGQQNKVLEAMACGCTVICSKEVRSGLDTLAPYLFVAEGPAEYAQYIIDANQNFDLNWSNRMRAREAVRQLFSWEHHTKKLLSIIEKG